MTLPVWKVRNRRPDNTREAIVAETRCGRGTGDAMSAMRRGADGGIRLARLSIIALTLLVGLVAMLSLSFASSKPVYSVAELQTGLRLHPQVWVGRAVLVQAKLREVVSPGTKGVADPLSPPPGVPVRILLAPSTFNSHLVSRGFSWLWAAPHVSPGYKNSLMYVLHNLPIIDRFFPSPERWNAPSVLRVTVLPMQGRPCPLPPTPNHCADVQLNGFQQRVGIFTFSE